MMITMAVTLGVAMWGAAVIYRAAVREQKARTLVPIKIRREDPSVPIPRSARW